MPFHTSRPPPSQHPPVLKPKSSLLLVPFQAYIIPRDFKFSRSNRSPGKSKSREPRNPEPHHSTSRAQYITPNLHIPLRTSVFRPSRLYSCPHTINSIQLALIPHAISSTSPLSCTHAQSFARLV
jgi:hypothetical protein